jgi:hypothetical protein
VTATINYDKHIVNLIDELSRTGHVTHTKYKKKSVTLHHNGGVRFSHQRILSIWRTRPASAHFDVDAAGAPAQFVEAHEYAWAVGNTRGNQESISIEMANISAGPHWEVADVTWQAAARLAGWLFAHVIDGRSSSHPKQLLRAQALVSNKLCWSVCRCSLRRDPSGCSAGIRSIPCCCYANCYEGSADSASA